MCTHALVRPVAALSVWQPELSIYIHGSLEQFLIDGGHTGFSNPLANPCVKEYLQFVREEQAQQPLPPRQAVPLFYDKFTRLIDYFCRLIAKGSALSPLNRYLIVRDNILCY